MYNVIKRLGERHQVRLLTYVDTEDEALQVRELERYCVSVTPVLRRPDMSRHNPLGPNPLCRVEFDTPPMREALRRELSRDLDVLQVDYTQMMHFVPPSRHFVRVLTEHDVSFLSQFRRISRQVSLFAKVREWIAWLKLINYELSWCRKYDLVLTVTEREGAFLTSYLPGQAVSSAAPTGVDVDYYAPSERTEVVPQTLLFVGYMRHAPNIEAALYLGREVFPRVKARCPQARLTIVGANPSADVRELEVDPSITVAGFVEDVRLYYRTHAVFVAPILSGAGVRVKILEAMAAGIPVVTTTMGAEGIAYTPGRDLLIGDDPDSIAEAIIGLLANSERAANVAARGRAVVETRYSWDAIVSNLETLYRSHLEAKRARVVTRPSASLDSQGRETALRHGRA